MNNKSTSKKEINKNQSSSEKDLEEVIDENITIRRYEQLIAEGNFDGKEKEEKIDILKKKEFMMYFPKN